MRYFGGKFRIRKFIVEELLRYKTDYYLEPFCGSCWVGELMPQRVKFFSDYNKYLIAMWQKVQEGWVPPTSISEAQYKFCREDPRVKDYMKGFVGFANSWGGKFWGGYARGTKSNGDDRNYALNASNQLTKRAKNFKHTRFVYSKYSDMFRKLMQCKNTWLVYCDPPYEGTTKYYGLPDFNYDVFWQNVQLVGKKHYVVVSSYNAPSNLTLLCEITTQLDIGYDEKLPRVEKLFTTGIGVL
jgi:DNA adenine methylase